MSTYEEDVALLHKALSEGVTGVPDMDLSDTALQPQSLDPCLMAGVADEDATEEEQEESLKDGMVYSEEDKKAWANLPRGRAWSPVFAEIQAERARQDAKHGGPEHDDEHETFDWFELLEQHCTHVYWLKQEEDVRRLLVQIAALAVAAVESMDRRETAKGMADG